MRTSLYAILCIVIRLGAVLLAVELVTGLLSIFVNAKTFAGFEGAALGLYGTFLAFAAALWIYPGVLARLAAGEASRQTFESPVGAEDLQYVALSVLGVWFAIGGISGLPYEGLRALALVNERASTSDGLLMAPEIAHIVGGLVRVALGIALAFGARRLLGWFRRFREHGLPPAAVSVAGAAEAEEGATPRA